MRGSACLMLVLVLSAGVAAAQTAPSSPSTSPSATSPSSRTTQPPSPAAPSAIPTAPSTAPPAPSTAAPGTAQTPPGQTAPGTAQTPQAAPQPGVAAPKPSQAPNPQTSSGRPAPGGANSSEQSKAANQRGKNAVNDSISDCLKMWEPATHMSKDAWARTCRRVQNRIDNLKVETLNTTAPRRGKSTSRE